MTAIVRRVPTGPVFLLTAEPVAETPAMHVRNALMLLGLLRQMHPALEALLPELPQAERRAEAALKMLEHGAPAHLCRLHVTKAIHSLLVMDCDWEVITFVPTACARLFRALFQLWEDA